MCVSGAENFEVVGISDNTGKPDKKKHAEKKPGNRDSYSNDLYYRFRHEANCKYAK